MTQRGSRRPRSSNSSTVSTPPTAPPVAGDRKSHRTRTSVFIVEQPGGGQGAFRAPTRKLGPTGVTLLHGGFFHPETSCKVSLINNVGQEILLAGKVASCGHVAGRVHRVAVMFNEKIDPGQFISALSSAQPSAEPVGGAVLLRYVDAVRRRLAALESCIAEGRLDQVREACLAMRDSASGFGFRTLSDAAAAAVKTLDATSSVAEAVEELRKLVDVGSRLAVKAA